MELKGIDVPSENRAGVVKADWDDNVIVSLLS